MEIGKQLVGEIENIYRRSIVCSLVQHSNNRTCRRLKQNIVGSISNAIYRVVFLTGPPDFQYQNEKTCSANEELFYIENFVKN